MPLQYGQSIEQGLSVLRTTIKIGIGTIKLLVDLRKEKVGVPHVFFRCHVKIIGANNDLGLLSNRLEMGYQ